MKQKRKPLSSKACTFAENFLFNNNLKNKQFMRKFTKLMFALAMFVGGVIDVAAKTLEVDLSQMAAQNYGGTATWNKDTGVFAWTSQYGNSIELPNLTGNLTSYTTLNFEIDKGTQENASEEFRFLFYWEGSGTTAVIYTGKTSEETQSVLLSEIADGSLTTEKLAAITTVNIAGQGATGNVVIKKIWLEGPDDPLAVPKERLQNAINVAKLYNPIAKTEESFAVLTKAIEEADAALASKDANEESLEAARNALNAAIEKLELKDGYTNLTKDMFYKWSGAGADATQESSLGDGAIVKIGEAIAGGSVVAGVSNGTVYYYNYADLTDYSKIIFTGTPGIPLRLLLNREYAESGEGGNFIEDKDPSPTIGEDGILEYDLTDATKFPYAHLNAIKANYGGASGFITGIYLYKTPEKITVKVNNGAGYRTFVSEYATDWSDVEDVTAYTATVTNNEVTFTKVDGTVPANTGLLLKAQDGTYTVPVAEEAGDVKSALVGVTTVTEVPAGSFVLYNGKDGVGFYKTAAKFTVGANTAYIPATTAAARTFIALPGNETTGVKAIEAVEADGKFFDLQGRQVSKPTKGLYISNGKKYIVK